MTRQTQGRAARKAGNTFESYLDTLFAAYSAAGIMHIEKTPEPMQIVRSMGQGKFLACFKASAQPDYKGVIAGGRCIVLEAKHTDGDRINASVLTDNEREELEKYWKMGAVSGVIVSFGMRKFCYIPYIAWANMEKFAGLRHIKAADAETWECLFFSEIDKNIKESIKTVDNYYQSAYNRIIKGEGK